MIDASPFQRVRSRPAMSLSVAIPSGISSAGPSKASRRTRAMAPPNPVMPAAIIRKLRATEFRPRRRSLPAGHNLRHNEVRRSGRVCAFAVD